MNSNIEAMGDKFDIIARISVGTVKFSNFIELGSTT